MSRISRPPRLVLVVQRAVAPRWLPGNGKLREWAASVLVEDVEATVRLVGRKEARALNGKFRGRRNATNVLTFGYPESRPLAGDIAICVPVVEREASLQGKAREAHLAHLLVHGMLHLQGFDHRRRIDAELMEGIEREIIGKLGYPDPYKPALRRRRAGVGRKAGTWGRRRNSLRAQRDR